MTDCKPYCYLLFGLLLILACIVLLKRAQGYSWPRIWKYLLGEEGYR